MAQCVKESKQIPCCGDTKHTNDEIATFESSGYVEAGVTAYLNHSVRVF